MHLVEFQPKGRDARVKERSGAQEHFLDLCRVVDAPTPVEADSAGEFFAVEKGAEKLAGMGGWADVWYRDHFAWEYKGRRCDLAKVSQQLHQYLEHFENQPLLVVSDLDVIEIHTNVTGTVKQVDRITLDTITDDASLQVLRAVFFAPQMLRPTVNPEAVTKQAAARFGELAASMEARGHDPHAIAHLLMQLLFCLFAEDTGLVTFPLQITPFALPEEQGLVQIIWLVMELDTAVLTHPHPFSEFAFMFAGTAMFLTEEGPPAQVIRTDHAGTEAIPEAGPPGTEVTASVGDVAIFPSGNVSDTRAGEEGGTLLVLEIVTGENVMATPAG